MEDAKQLLRGFKNLKSLKDDDRFRQYFAGNAEAIKDIHEKLSTIDPNDTVGVARLQGQLEICKVRQFEYDNCEKKIFVLEQAAVSKVKKKHETGNVPPKEGEQ